MMNIPCPMGWTDGFVLTTSGDGVGTIDANGVASLASGIGTGTAYLQKYVRSTPGEVLTFACLGRRVSGVDASSGALKVEWPADSPGEESVCFITSPEWREYEVSIGASPVAVPDYHFNLAIGLFSADGGEIAVVNPRIRIANSRAGAARVHAYGLIKVASGVPSLDVDFVQSAITALAYDAPSKTLTLTTPKGMTGVAAGAAPLPFVQLTTETAAATYVAKIGEYSRGTGTCKVKVYNMTTGAEVDIAGIAGTFYLSVLLVL